MVFKDYICEVKITQYLIVMGVNARDAEENVRLYLTEDWDEAIKHEWEARMQVVCRPYNPEVSQQ